MIVSLEQSAPIAPLDFNQIAAGAIEAVFLNIRFFEEPPSIFTLSAPSKTTKPFEFKEPEMVQEPPEWNNVNRSI